MISKDIRFYCEDGVNMGDIAERWVYDHDQRQWITVTMPGPVADPEEDCEAFEEEWEGSSERAKQLVAEHIDNAPEGVIGIQVDEAGKVTFVDKVDYDHNMATYYPTWEEFQLPKDGDKAAETVLRSELTELDRLSWHVDAVSYAGTERCVLKYSHDYKGFGAIWQEINIHARLPRNHPNILPLDRLVLEELSGTRVVGFTVPYVEGSDLDTNKSRPFKLKHLKQLMQAVDDLNYTHGIVHHDIAARNLLINPATDNLILFDFSVATKLGWKPPRHHLGESTAYLPERNDVKGVVFAAHEILTREEQYASAPQLRLLDETDLLAGPERWVKHPDVVLDEGLEVGDYLAELMRWVEKRRARPIEGYAEAAEPMEWPVEMREPPGKGMPAVEWEEARGLGLPGVEWVRPRSVCVEKGRRLLATGRYADEGEREGEVKGKGAEEINGEGEEEVKGEEEGEVKKEVEEVKGEGEEVVNGEGENGSIEDGEKADREEVGKGGEEQGGKGSEGEERGKKRARSLSEDRESSAESERAMKKVKRSDSVMEVPEMLSLPN